MAALGRLTVEDSPQLGQNVLIKELSVSQARDELQRVAHLPKLHQKLQKHLIDVAFGQLLGLDEDDSLESDDTLDVRASLESAKTQLGEDGFPELSQRLTSLIASLNSCTACSVQGTQAQELTDKPLVTPFTEHDAILRFFLSLKGSSPSIRRRQTTFQKTDNGASGTALEDEEGSQSLFLPSNQQQELTSTVFAEAPNPDALFDLHGTSVLLPSEINFNRGSSSGSNAAAATATTAATGTQVRENELAELSQGLQSRPSWAPASVQGLPPLYSEGWLPITPALLEMRGDARKVVPPPPLNVPLSTLAIERKPGAVTGFSSTAVSSASNRGGSKDIKEKLKRIENSGAVTEAAAGKVSNCNNKIYKDKKTLLGSDSLWTLEEAELARDALLSLQGVHSSLLRLRGALAAPHALVHPASAGLLKRIERAASCRHRLQGFIDAFSSFTTSTGSNTSNNNIFNDPVLSALAAGLHDVLLSFSQQLSSLETSHATEWVHTVNIAATDGGPAITGKVLQGQGLSLTRVAVMTGKVQTILRVLCSMFWCNEVTTTEDDSKTSSTTRCEWEVNLEGPPRGPALLSLLCRYAEEAEEPYTEILHFLFARAAQPYLLFLRQWAYSTTEIDLNHPYSIKMPYTILATESTTLDDFGLSSVGGSGGGNFISNNDSSSSSSRKRNTRPDVAIPGSLPNFLFYIETTLLRTGVQLRLMHSIHKDGCRELIAALNSMDTDENSTQDMSTAITGDEDDVEELIFSLYSFSGAPVFDTLGFGLDNKNRDNRESYGRRDGAIVNDGGAGAVISQTQASLRSPPPPPPVQRDNSGLESLLLLPQTALQIKLLLQQTREEEGHKRKIIDAWSSKLNAERREIEAVERNAVLGAVTVATEAIAEKEAARMEASSLRQSQKQELLKEQLEAIASVQLARSGGGGVVGGGGEDVYKDDEEEKSHSMDGLSNSAQVDEAMEQQKEATTGIIEDEDKDEEGKEGRIALPTMSDGITTTALSSVNLVPMSATIEASFTSPISSQYRLISHACLDFFINHLQLQNHLSFLRCTFFLEAGDWADEFLKPLSTKTAALQPLSAHSVHGALQDSLQSSSLGKKVDSLLLAENLEAEILAGPTAISSFLTCLERHYQQQQEEGTKVENKLNLEEILATGTVPRNRASAPLLVSPAALDGLDIVLLRYKTSWPLAAILTEDTSLAYAAVFSAMLRVRRVSAALTKAWSPLAPRLSDAPTIRPSPKTTHRVQKLRVFIRYASQLTDAMQYFQGLTTSGPTWAALERAVAANSSDSSDNNRTWGGGGDSNASVSDLQELLEMHRTYVFTSAVDGLTLCGRKQLQNGVDAALHAALLVASKIDTAVEAGRGPSGSSLRSTDSSWMHTMSNDTTWNAIQTSINEFENAVKAIRKELTSGVGVSGPLAGLAAMLN